MNVDAEQKSRNHLPPFLLCPSLGGNEGGTIISTSVKANPKRSSAIAQL
jgi:hypothetical protein